MTAQGVDFLDGWQPGVASKLKAQGKTFAMRYLKNLTLEEVQDWASAGMGLGLVYETTGQTALGGQAAGVADATRAIAQARALGAPVEAAIWFAGNDFDTLEGQDAATAAYGDGLKSVTGPAGYAAGGYGGIGAVQALAGHVDDLWQTYAWSNGQWYSGAVLRQYQNNVSVAGIPVDLDQAEVDPATIGIWFPVVAQAAPAPAPEPAPPTPPEADLSAGSSYTLHRTATVYYTAAEAAAHQADGQPTGTWPAGVYTVYRTNPLTGMVNITRVAGEPGGWLNPADNAPPNPASAGGRTTEVYEVVPGDNEDAIAERHGMTLAEIELLNPQSGHPPGNFKDIWPGDHLVVLT